MVSFIAFVEYKTWCLQTKVEQLMNEAFAEMSLLNR